MADRMNDVGLRDLSVDRDGVRVVHEIAMHVDPGTWFGLIGANGSGKTTLLRAAAGRLPIAGGQCLIGGEDHAADRAARAGRIAFAPPPEMLPAALRTRDVLGLVAGHADLALERLGPLRDAMAIDPLLDRWIGNCSAGMRQRISLACAIAEGKSIIILDEPFNWLDPVVAFDIKAELRALVGRGVTLITALHDLSALAYNCDAGIMMGEGRIALRLDRAALQDAMSNMPAFERRMIDALRSCARP